MFLSLQGDLYCLLRRNDLLRASRKHFGTIFGFVKRKVDVGAEVFVISVQGKSNKGKRGGPRRYFSVILISVGAD